MRAGTRYIIRLLEGTIAYLKTSKSGKLGFITNTKSEAQHVQHTGLRGCTNLVLSLINSTSISSSLLDFHYLLNLWLFLCLSLLQLSFLFLIIPVFYPARLSCSHLSTLCHPHTLSRLTNPCSFSPS